MKAWLHPVIVYRFFIIEAEDAIHDSEFQKLDIFFCTDLAEISEIHEGGNFGIDNL